MNHYPNDMGNLQPARPTATPGQPSWPPTPPSRPRRWPIIALSAAVTLMTGVAVAGWLRPTKPAPAPTTPTYTEQQVADAKAHVCATYDKVHQAVLVNTGRTGSDDATDVLARAANARMALFDGGEYLSTKVAEEPATPPDLAKAIRDLVSAYQQLAIDYMADAEDSEKKSAGDAINQAGGIVYEICK